MADEIRTSLPEPGALIPDAAPVVVPAVAAPTEPSAAPVPASPEPAPAPIEEPKAELTADVPSMLEEAAAKPAETVEKGKEEAKSDEKPSSEPEKAPEAAPEAPKPVETAPVEVPKPLDLKFELPEALKGTKEDDPRLVSLRTVLGEVQANPQEAGQKLIQLHADAMKAYAEEMAAKTLENQHAAFNDVRKRWRDEVKADTQIGGAGHMTAMRAIARARDQFISGEPAGSPKYQADVKAFDELMRVTGVGDHPVFLKFLHRVAGMLDEPALPPDNVKPPKDIGKAPNGRSPLYDNPRSNQSRQ